MFLSVEIDIITRLLPLIEFMAKLKKVKLVQPLLFPVDLGICPYDFHS